MKIRQYTAATMQEALLKIKLDLGPDAVILHQRVLKKGGFLGFFGKEVVEVLAAVDNTPPSKKKTQKFEDEEPLPPPRSRAAVKPAAQGGVGPWDAPLPGDEAQGAVPMAGRPFAMPPGWPEGPGTTGAGNSGPASSVIGAVPAGYPSGDAAAITAAVLEQLGGQVREAVSQAVGSVVGDAVAHAVEAAVGEVADKVEAAVSRLETITPPKGTWSAPQQRLHDRLVKGDLDPALARQVLARLHGAGATTEEAMAERLPEVLGGLIKVAGPIVPAEKGMGPKIVALVGPTGVGKTTTIAKLAATHRLSQNMHVGLITIDTYRIAAVEQLKTYGDIIGIPVEVVMTPGGLREALGKFGDRDLVLIDTAGRSPSHKLHLNELKGFLEAVPSREVHLVLAATATRANLMKAIESFAITGIDRLLFTKIDEAATVGAVISAAHASGKPLSYLTTGQSVPDDLRDAEAAYLAAELLG